MNIPYLIAATQSLEDAIASTFDPDERGKLTQINRRLRKILRKHGVFLGEQKEMPCKIPRPDSESGHAKS